MKKDKYVLAVDLGTSGPRVCLVTLYGEVVERYSEEVKTTYLPGGGAEQNAEDWWTGFKSSVTHLLSKAAVPVDDILCISIGAQWSTTVPVSKEGLPLMNALTWQDSRGAPYTHKLIGSALNIEGYHPHRLYHWLKKTGGAPGKSGTDSISHVLYIKHKYPEIYEATYKFLEPKDFLNFRLTGKFASTPDTIVLYWATDNRNINNVKYDFKMLKMVGLEREKLPDLIASTDVLGTLKQEVAKELGLSPKTQVIGGASDTSVSAIGAGAVKDYESFLCVGTSSWIQCHVPYKKVDISMNMGSFPSGIPGKYLLLNENKTAGECWRHLRDKILYPGSEVPDDFFDQVNTWATNAPPGSNKLIFTPWLAGERTPMEDDTVRGGFFNWSLHTTREDLARAVFEGVGYNLKTLLKGVEKYTKKKTKALNAIGGGCRSKLWCQIFADILNCSIRQVKDPANAGPRGAAWLGATALGKFTFDDIAQYIQYDETFVPNPQNREIYDELYREFMNSYKNNKSMYERLNHKH
ncbi:FGGY-family carbohydrate kinase [Deltaproteobacteria bacterium TL4]